MPKPTDEQVIQSIRLYRQTLQETQALYAAAGQLARGAYGWLASGDAAAVASQMNDLHQGFLMKVFAAVVPHVQGRTLEQRQLGRVLLEHIWGVPVMGRQLHESVDWLLNASQQFPWYDLVRPFAELPELRDRWGELETLATRMAHLLAAVDGEVSIADNTSIASMRREFAELLRRAPEHLTSDADTNKARDALNGLREAAQQLRAGVHAAATAPATGSTLDPQPGHVPATTDPPPAGSSPGVPSPTVAPPAGDRTPEDRLKDARAKLNQLIGLDAIKDQIQTLTNFLKMERQREAAGLPMTRPSLHMAFVGNPGTGKTTVARIVADIYGALGVLKKGHLVETDRTGLVAEYAGQTGPKANAKIDEALDGVLFIDEAYTLIDESGTDQYGREAVQTILKRMEDQRERLVVILAGYPVEMRKMIRSNPGLSSRVGTTMHFDDYAPEAMCRIFQLIAEKAKYTLPTESRRRLLRGFTYLFGTRDRHFGNGRTVRNSFERSVRRLANRLAPMHEVSHALLTTLEAEDIEVAGVALAHLSALADQPGKIRVKCPHCDEAQVIDDARLATEVSCGTCDARFEADWGEPVMDLPPPAAVDEEVADEPPASRTT